MPAQYPPPAAENPITHDAVMASIDAEAQAEVERTRIANEKLENAKLIQRWTDRMRAADKHDEDAFKEYEIDRKYARGDLNWLVDTNLINAILEILMAFIYAKDPDLSARPSAAIGESRLQKYAPIAKTVEIVVSRMFKRARLKTQAKRWVRSMMTVGVGWLTATLQTRTEIDPIVEKELNDLESKLRLLELQQSAVDRGDAADAERQKAEIRVKKDALEARRERQVDEGPVIDFRMADQVRVSPECGELENYLAAPWIAYYSYKDKTEARALLDWPDDAEHDLKFKKANLFMQRRKGGDAGGDPWMAVTDDKKAESTDGFVRFIEIWSKRDGMVFTLLDGINDLWGRKPYPPITGERFYHGFMLGCHFIDGQRHPQSDVYQLRKLQDEFGRTRSNFAEHRRRAVPATFFDGTQIDAETMKRITEGETAEFLEVSTTNQQPMQNAFFAKPYPAVDAGLYTTLPIQQDMEKVSGAQDAQQGSIQVQKTLGEAQIQQSGFMARTGARRDHVEDVLTEVAEYMAQLSLQVLDQADAIRYAGPQAVWTKLSVEEATTLFDIEIKAGSTGKPQQSADKEAWGTLMPLIQELIGKIGEARSHGDEYAAAPYIALLKQTAMVLDDRIDVEALLPVVPEDKIVPLPDPTQPPPLSPLDEAKIKKEQDQGYLYRAQGIAALAAFNLPPEVADYPGTPGPAVAGPGGPPDMAAVLGPILAGIKGGGAPTGPVPTPEVPDPTHP
jgi:hypothetical protein